MSTKSLQRSMWKDCLPLKSDFTFAHSDVEHTKVAMYLHALHNNMIINQTRGNCRIKENSTMKDFVKALSNSNSLSCIFSQKSLFNNEDNETHFVSNESYFHMRGEEENIYLELLSVDKSEYDVIIKIITEHTEEVPNDPSGTVYMLVKRNDEFSIQPCGMGGLPLIKCNYTDNVIKSFDKIAKEFINPNPYGRLAIVYGEPGTGKTYFIRGLMNELEDAYFVIIPPNMISQLTDPQFIPAILEFNYDSCSDGSSMIFILEDADQCLQDRNEGDIEAVSTILNFSDGIIGNILDVKIIATTNIDNINLDPAIKRKGRLLESLNIDRLPKAQAQLVLNNLMGNDSVSIDDFDLNKFYSNKSADHFIPLTEVYGMYYSWKEKNASK